MDVSVRRSDVQELNAGNEPTPGVEQPQAWLEQLIRDRRQRRIARPALLAVMCEENAKFLDDFLWQYIGDPVLPGRFKDKNPDCDDALFSYDYNYNQPLINGYTNDGMLIHVRQTRDTDAPKLQQHLVITGDMETRQITRWRVNEIEDEGQTDDHIAYRKLYMTTDALDSLDGEPPFDPANPMLSMQRLDAALHQQDQRRDKQAYIKMSTQGMKFRPFDQASEQIGGISRVVRDRDRIAWLAMAAGWSTIQDTNITAPNYFLKKVV